MAAPARGRQVRRPGRTLLLFLAGVVAMFALVGFIDLEDGGGHGTWQPRLGLDLQGGTRITLQAESSGGDVTAANLSQARDIIDQRVNATGVSEAEVTTQGGNQIVIEIPGQERGDIVDQVGRTAQLQFRLVWQQQVASTGQALDDAAAQQAQATVDAADWSALSLDQLIAGETQTPAALPAEYQDAVAALQQQAQAFVCSPGELSVVDTPDEPIVTCDPKTGEVMVLSPAVIGGSHVKDANAAIPQNTAQWVVDIELDGEGSDTFDTVTEALTPAQGRFAVVLDGEVITAPTSNAHITNGKAQISGSFTQETAVDLANQLKYGALPLTFVVNGVSVEGPTLAGSQLQAGLIAGAIGMALVLVYGLFYYRGLGLVVVASLGVAAAITYGLVLLLGQAMGFTLTLPGIAGLIVAIGITADSFIVLFERIRDEVRDGKSLRLAVEAGWERARSTILAADAVSFLAAFILFIFAIGVVRGFAFALGLTTLVDILVVFFFTKPLMSVLARTKFFGQGHQLSGLDAAHLGIEGRKVTEFATAKGGRS
ncbi:MAG: protein translocase subunit SecD [Aeromicrobium sp.]|uniref:protein translocase subunit SecD n=1 Tax=Aeromicrobium sp. TaxID=1871063 RepID=UPI0025B7F60B|nr:protein translocase subunit SecD [Aeromicrobium sp.]MDF1705563.1 protein translocase subunit SecD [Aeromicrobium sp.]